MKADAEGARASNRASSAWEVADGSSRKATALITTIVVPIDFSSTSLIALDYALSLAATSSAALHLIHAVEPAFFLTGMDASPMAVPEGEAVEQCRRELAGIVAGRNAPGILMSSSVHVGGPAHQIVAAAMEMRADLLVISTHGRTGLKHLLLGSVAERIIREAQCPVLVVREREHEFASVPKDGAAAHLHPRKILVPTDFSSCSAEAMRYAGNFARQCGGKITLFHRVHLTAAFGTTQGVTPGTDVSIEAACHTAEQALARSLSQCLPADVADTPVVQVGPVLEGVPDFAKEGNFDLIVCAAHGTARMKRHLLGSTADKIVRHAPCPVLVVPDRSSVIREKPDSEDL